MDADYLWDRSGPADPEIERLERLLSTFSASSARCAVTAGDQQPAEPGAPAPVVRGARARWTVLAVAAALILGVGIGHGLGRSSQVRSAEGRAGPLEPEIRGAASTAAAGPSPPPLSTADAPTPPLHPTAPEPAPRTPQRALAPERRREVLNPFAKPGQDGIALPAAPQPPSTSSGILDPWASKSLSHAEVRKIVSAQRGSLDRRCWQPALLSAPAGAPSTVRVSVTLTIAPTGQVRSVETSGAPKHPGLGKCVSDAVSLWRFPKAEGSTTVTVPLVFSRG